MGPAAVGIPGSDLITEYHLPRDVLALVATEYATALRKPRLEIVDRADVWRRFGPPTASNDPRFNANSRGCAPGTHSYAGSGRSCTFGSVPICQGGTRDGYWCPDPEDDTYCPSGTCDLVSFDPTWVLTVPTAEHEAALAELDHLKTIWDGDPVNWDIDQLCDGSVAEDDGLDDTGCGTGYPDFANLAAALATLPANSIGHALATAQNAWPLTARPVYYGPAITESGGEYTFRLNGVAMDLRKAAWREWISAVFLDRAYQSLVAAGFSDAQIRAWPIALSGWLSKPGWWAYYTPHPGDSPTCVSNALAGTNMWGGPNRPVAGLDASQITACASAGGPLHDTPYAPREFEVAVEELGLLLLAQTTSGDFCAAESPRPFAPCATSTDCSGGTCESAITNYFTDVVLTSDDAPAQRGKKDEAVLARLRKNPRWWGSRHNAIDSSERPWLSESLCRPAPVVSAGGPYTVASGGTVRLVGRCVADGDVTPEWTVASGGTSCAFEDPFDDSAATDDPQANLAGCTASGVIQLACGSATATAQVVVE